MKNRYGGPLRVAVKAPLLLEIRIRPVLRGCADHRDKGA
jgi:hypothetical protein